MSYLSDRSHYQKEESNLQANLEKIKKQVTDDYEKRIKTMEQAHKR